MGARTPLVGFLVVPVVFGTAWLMVTVLLGLVPSWGSLLPSTKESGEEGLQSELVGSLHPNTGTGGQSLDP